MVGAGRPNAPPEMIALDGILEPELLIVTSGVTGVNWVTADVVLVAHIA